MLLQVNALWQFISDLLRQKKYVRTELVPLLDKLQREAGLTFEPYLYKKITDYYGLLTTGVLAASFSRLHGRKLSQSERQVSTWLGAMTPLFDDFFDRNLVDDGEISTMMAAPFDFQTGDLHQRAILYFHQHILGHLGDLERYKALIQKVFQAQIDSRMQADPSITDEALWKITYDKGGYSLLTYREVLAFPTDPEERAVIYQLGGILQLCNDIFDIYKDLQEGIITLPLRCQDFRALKARYLEETLDWIVRTRALPCPKPDIERFITFLLIVICRGLVALDQLIGLQQARGSSFSVEKCQRSELICDMARPSNFLKSLRLASELRKKTGNIDLTHPVPFPTSDRL